MSQELQTIPDSKFDIIRVVIYLLFTLILLIISFFPEGWLFYFYTMENPDFIFFLFAPLLIFLAYCLTVVFFGVVHSQLIIRFLKLLPYSIEPGRYPHRSSKGKLIAMRLSADGIFKAMLKVFTFLPFVWGRFLFPYGMRLYGLKCGKGVHVATKTWIDTTGLVEIGDNCFIGWNSAVSGHANEGGAFVIEPLKIGRNTTIGSYSVVAPGCDIGENTILGLHSGWKKGTKVPPNGVWVGTPAKLIKELPPRKKKE
ncbi:MAG: acyltransferase [Candidatus Hodarchaeales archaeon]|jgi:carbonic anhydrase/acetyltransferase-like protein (isoleucine patch superfamily)